MYGKIAIILLVLAAALLVSTPVMGVDYGSIHCENTRWFNLLQCTDGNEWFTWDGEVTADMRYYYEELLGLDYIVPQTNPETWTVSNMSP